MKNHLLLVLAFVCILTALASCKKENTEEVVPVITGNMLLEFDNVAGNKDLYIGGDSTYVNGSGETFSVLKFEYYISNISLVRNDNSILTLPVKYYLIDKAGSVGNIKSIANVPAGSYKGIRYLVGVDSAKTVQGAQTGELDPSLGMVWDWNTGYIFMKLEGKCNVAGTPDSSFAMHVSGYRKADNTYALHWIEVSFGGQPLVINTSATPTLHLKTDLLEIFQNPFSISISDNPIITSSGQAAVSIANNYADMFTFGYIQN